MSVIDNSIPDCQWVTGKITAACVPLFVGHLVQFMFAGVGMLFIINVMIGGYQLAMGSITGDKGAGKDRLTWSILGLIITICVFIIFDNVLGVLFG